MRTAGVSDGLSTMTRDLAPSLAPARHAVTAPTPNLLAYWRMDVIGLLRINPSSCHDSQAFQPLPARLMTSSSSPMRFLIA